MENIVQPQRHLTVEEYFELEETSLERHEYIDGLLYAFAGASPRHNDIVLNIAERFRAAARETSCRIHALEVRLQVTPARYVYPDIQVVCDEPVMDERFRTRPCVVVEVLSPSTEMTDRREKIFLYRGVDGLRAYYIVWQDQMKVQQHWRDENGDWQIGTLFYDGVLHVPCLGFDLPIQDIYAGVSFDTQETSGSPHANSY
jgi:Uma2 family endonuclease